MASCQRQRFRGTVPGTAAFGSYSAAAELNKLRAKFRKWSEPAIGFQTVLEEPNDGPLIEEITTEFTSSRYSAEANSEPAGIHIVDSGHKPWEPWEEVAKTIAPDFPADTRALGDPPMEKWYKFQDPNNNRIWYNNEESADWFYEDAPEPWRKYRTHESLVWWWNVKNGSWFYEPASRVDFRD